MIKILEPKEYLKEDWQEYCKKRNIDVRNNPPTCIKEHINLLKQDVDVMSGFITKILELLDEKDK